MKTFNRSHASVLHHLAATMFARFFALVCVLFFICEICAVPLDDVALPQSINVCKRNEDDYSTCLTNAIQESWPVFAKGIPELRSPSLEPLKIERVERNLKAGPFVGSVVLRDVTFYGLANTKILSAQPQFTGDRIKLDLDVEIPGVVIECDYKAQGAVSGAFEVGGKGHFNITMDGVTAKWTLDGRVRNNRWTVEHFRIDPEIKGMKVYFSDLLNGNEMLNDAAMLLVNQYWPMFFREMKPIIEALSDAPLADFVNNIVFSKIAVSKIFP